MTTNAETTISRVLETPAASPEATHSYFMNKLAMETDVSDVRHDMTIGADGFVLIDVRSPKAYEECHVPGAINLHSAIIAEATTGYLSRDKPIVVYCWSPACNGGTKAAAKLSGLGFRVKEMIGGIEYWRREGFPVEGTLGASAPLVG